MGASAPHAASECYHMRDLFKILFILFLIFKLWVICVLFWSQVNQTNDLSLPYAQVMWFLPLDENSVKIGDVFILSANAFTLISSHHQSKQQLSVLSYICPLTLHKSNHTEGIWRVPVGHTAEKSPVGCLQYVACSCNLCVCADMQFSWWSQTQLL